jgi:HK97 family phage prohead protease
VFDRWTEIDSFFEGNFMERIAPGAFKKTIKEQRDQIRVLFNHGKDPQLGNKAMGAIKTLREDSEGAFYEVPLFRGVPDIIMDGLREKQYGASFKFRVMREEIRQNPDATEDNPKGLDQRTIRELQLFEFGPVTFPAYPEATAGLRSITDDYFLDGLAHADPELVRMAAGGTDLAGLIARRMGLPTRFDSKPKDEETPVDGAEKREQPEERAAMEVFEATGRVETRENVSGAPEGLPHGVFDETGKLVACHATAEQARAHAEALEGEREIAPVVEEDQDRTSQSDEVDAVVTNGNSASDEEDENAAPGQGSTPLIGPAGFRESWRL